MAVCIALAAGTILAVLGVHYAGSSSPGRLDRALDFRFAVSLGGRNHLVLWFAHLGDPLPIFAFSLLTAGVMLLLRRPRGVLLAACAAPVATSTTEWVLKPLIHRTAHSGAHVFPSGHATGIFTVAFLIIILMLDQQSTALFRFGRSIMAIAVLAVAAFSSAALVAARFHYSTDTLGGASVGLVTVLILSLAIDTVADRSEHRG